LALVGVSFECRPNLEGVPMDAGIQAKPKYLGTLNTIAIAEADAGRYLRAWAGVTPNADLRYVLELIAARETSHGEVFCRRIHELGFELRTKDDPTAEERCRRYGSPNVSDVEKIGDLPALGSDPFASIEQQLAEGLYDPLTALLMRWYVAEERDSGNRLREAFAKVETAGGRSNGSSGELASADAQAIMACMTAGFDRVERALLRLARRAQRG
jgi:rubrerythrin